MNTDSNIRTLRPLPPVVGEPCAMCGSRLDVVLCSFAFERVHRRVPLCREHRQPLLEIDHFTRPMGAAVEDVPAAWTNRLVDAPRRRLAAARSPRRRTDPGIRTLMLVPGT